ncbi:voltage-dependent T-type calcium channel subunit alpha-1H [Tachysurus ichikawai]
MHLFGCKFTLRLENGDTISDRKNFDSLLWAIVTVFQAQRCYIGSRTVPKFDKKTLTPSNPGPDVIVYLQNCSLDEVTGVTLT